MYFLLGLLLLSALRIPPSVVLAASTTLTPTADAYVNSSAPSAYYGALPTLRVDGSPTISAYLFFDLSGLTATITQARLGVYANSASSASISVHPVGSAAWRETSLICLKPLS